MNEMFLTLTALSLLCLFIGVAILFFDTFQKLLKDPRDKDAQYGMGIALGVFLTIFIVAFITN